MEDERFTEFEERETARAQQRGTTRLGHLHRPVGDEADEEVLGGIGADHRGRTDDRLFFTADAADVQIAERPATPLGVETVAFRPGDVHLAVQRPQGVAPFVAAFGGVEPGGPQHHDVGGLSLLASGARTVM